MRLALLLLLLAAPALAQTKPATAPTTQPLTRDAEVKRLFDFLTAEYGRLFQKNNDWVNRAVAIISLSRLPTDGATNKILEQMQSEKHPVGKLVAWQAMLGRAKLLTDAQYKAFYAETIKMLRAGLFAGDLRIALMEVLSATPVTIDSRNYWKEVFVTTSALDSSDVPTLIAMGKAVRAWGDPVLYEALIAAMLEPDIAPRAELILKATGAQVPWTLSKEARVTYDKWWKANKAELTAAKPPADGWKRLAPQYVPGPEDAAKVNPKDPRWYKELELGALGLKSFDFVFCLDCSRSMGPEIERLKRDLRVIHAALAQVAVEARIGVTQFAPGNTVELIPLSGNIGALAKIVQGIGIIGPAGDEEWAGAVDRSIKENKWAQVGDRNRRVIVIISDEPIAKEQHDRLVPIATKAAKDAFRIYGVTIRPANVLTDPLRVAFDRTGDDDDDDGPPMRGAPGMRRRPGGAGGPGGKGWAAYDEVARLTGGSVVHARVPQGTFGLGGAPPPGYEGAIAPVYPAGGPNKRLLTRVLTDAINPQYADRVEPLVKVLIAYAQKSAVHEPEKRGKFGSGGLPASFPDERRK
ncbi:MAG: vWA domain-containing protein [Phycisphaerae bacterium]